MAWRSRWKWPMRAALCAAAMGSGAFAAHVTADSPQSGHPLRERERPPPILAEPAVPPTRPDTALLPPERAEGASAAPRAPEVAVPATPPTLGGGLVITGRTPHRLVLFTFDDGPDNRYTRRLLDELDRAEVRAVFFLTAGRIAGTTPWARDNAEIAREIARRGHVIGSHGRDHVALTRVSGDALDEQVDGADEALFEVLGLRPRLFRPPGGARSARTDGYLAARGYTTVLWNLGTGDPQVETADAVVETFRHVLAWREREDGSRGGIVLLHDIHRWSLEAFPRIVALLDARNCLLLRRGEELYDFVEDPSLFVVPRPDGSGPSDEAPPLVLPPDVLAERQARARERAEARYSEP